MWHRSPTISRSPSFKREMLYLLVGTYAALLIVSAFCASGSMMGQHEPQGHHGTHHLSLCSWACHVSQTSSTFQQTQNVFAVVLISIAFVPWFHRTISQRPLLLHTSRGPPFPF